MDTAAWDHASKAEEALHRRKKKQTRKRTVYFNMEAIKKERDRHAGQSASSPMTKSVDGALCEYSTRLHREGF
ncbi:MAG: hypothetical protein FWG10_13025 [Eubacteriaceae bacterium]|nr:hypothetical protein [Eubacteriaceae bacterium]